jgi:hypothetical protein
MWVLNGGLLILSVQRRARWAMSSRPQSQLDCVVPTISCMSSSNVGNRLVLSQCGRIAFQRSHNGRDGFVSGERTFPCSAATDEINLTAVSAIVSGPVYTPIPSRGFR